MEYRRWASSSLAGKLSAAWLATGCALQAPTVVLLDCGDLAETAAYGLSGLATLNASGEFVNRQRGWVLSASSWCVDVLTQTDIKRPSPTSVSMGFVLIAIWYQAASCHQGAVIRLRTACRRRVCLFFSQLLYECIHTPRHAHDGRTVDNEMAASVAVLCGGNALGCLAPVTVGDRRFVRSPGCPVITAISLAPSVYS